MMTRYSSETMKSFDGSPQCRAVKSAAQETDSQSSSTILMVEDEAILRGAVAKSLQKRGFLVLEAGDGNDAMHLLSTYGGEIHCMVLDVTLPGVPSPEVFKGARRLRPDMRVVITSAHPRKTAELCFEGIQIEQFIRKPYSVSDLVTFFQR